MFLFDFVYTCACVRVVVLNADKVILKQEENQKLEEDKAKMEAKMKDHKARLKETLAHTKEVYEKEIRRARKEAFKSNSENISLHEQLRSERDQRHSTREELEHTKRKVEATEKEAFSAKYRLVEVEEELSKLRQQMRLVEEERDALRTSLKEEEVARIAAEGRIPLPFPATPDEFSSPKKQRATPTPTPKRRSRIVLDDPFLPNTQALEEKVTALKRQIEIETLSRKSAEDLVHFMKLECQMKRCSCRLAENGHHRDYVFDEQFDLVIADIQKQIDALTPHDQREISVHHDHEDVVDPEPLIEFSPVTGTFRTVKSPEKPRIDQAGIFTTPSAELLIDVAAPVPAPIHISESPSMLSLSGSTMLTNRSSQDNCRVMSAQDVPENAIDEDDMATPKRFTHSRPSEADLLSFTPFQVPTYTNPIHSSQDDHVAKVSNRPLSVSIPINPTHSTDRPILPPTSHSSSYIISNTTTVKIPLADEPSTPTYKAMQSNPAFAVGYSPGTTKTREEALQSIERWRRGRSKSVVVNGTPRRFGPTIDKLNKDESIPAGKRDCSAPMPKVTRDF
jgi:hypothetical protein